MKRLWPRRDPDGENGQALILIAVMFPLLVLLMGVGIEGGRVFAEHQQVQSAADVSALAGAQALPCSTTDTTCITNAEQVACDYAKDNGVTSCSPGTGSYPSADVPPVSCSPYDFEDYGNGATNPKCKSATAPPFYDYVEVQLTKSLGVVPIFQIPVTVSAHAVAKHGVLEPGDFALVTLNTTCPSMNMTGSNETTIIGSAFSNGCISGNGSLTCSGGWFASGSISGVTTEDGGTPSYSPPACGAGSGPGMPPQGSLPGEADPYKGSLPPPTVTGNGNPNSGTFPSCQECTQAGWWFSFDTKTWTQGGSPSGHAELFPGTYTSFPNGHGSNGAPNFTLNPGVYTFTGTIDMTGGSYCIFGSPSCDGGTFCSSDTFANGSAAANQWYYKCSPWGYWDGSTSIDGVARPGTLPTAAPTWYDISNDSSTSIPLNGVTLYFPNGSGGMVSGGLQMKGNSVANYLAAPNPCPGTGSSYSAGSSVEFPAGVASATYSYLSGTQPYIEGTTASPMTSTSPAWSEVYPNADLSLLGECQNTLNVWPGEMPVPQHLHFIFYQQGIGNKVRGTSNQNFWGIFYDPGGQLQILGNTGSSSAAGGPPWMSGQIIVGSTDWSGNTTISVFYRPCAAGSTACGSGRGEQLVQ